MVILNTLKDSAPGFPALPIRFLFTKKDAGRRLHLFAYILFICIYLLCIRVRFP